MMLRMELWVEGRTDAPVGDREPPGGALIPLLRKVLAGAEGMTQDALDKALPETNIHADYLKSRCRDRIKLPDGGRQKLSAFSSKVLGAIQQERRRRPDTLVVAVWDRDRREDRLRARDEVLNELRRLGATGAAIGVCIEEVEAWLLADPGAFRRAFGRGPTSGLTGNPESEPDPKAKLRKIRSEHYPELDEKPTAVYRRLAEAVDVDMLIRTCPRGFGAFEKALRELIVDPHLRPASR